MSEHKRVLVVLPVEGHQREQLEEAGRGGKYDLEFIYRKGAEVTAAEAASADIILGNVRADLLNGGDKPEWMQLTSAGADSYAPDTVLGKDAILTNAVGAYGLSVSEHMLGFTMALFRKQDVYDRHQAASSWAHAGTLTAVEGSVIAVLGVGDIGGSYARKVKALGAYTIGVRRTKAPKPEYLDEQYTLDGLDSVLPRADLVAMVLPGGPATHHLMNEDRLLAMKPGAYILNVGRGNAIDPEALKKVLAMGHLGGAALDVTEPEPLPAEDPLWQMPRVIITPHVAGGASIPATARMIFDIVAENLRRYCAGEPLRNVVDRGLGY